MKKLHPILLFLLLFLLSLSAVQAQTVVKGSGTVSGTSSITVLPSSAGPLVQSQVNSHVLIVSTTGQPVYLNGSHTWNDGDDTSTSAVPSAFPFSKFVAMLKANKHNVTILWHKDLPRECNWQNSSNYNLAPQPWPRTGPGNASDGLLKFDVSQFNQAYFDRLRSLALTLYQNNIYAIVELFDGNNLTATRCGTNASPNGDGFPLTGANNINGVNDGYTGSGSCGVQAFTMTTNNAVTNIQDAYAKKVVDTLNDLPNILYEVSEEQPGPSFSTCSGGWGGTSSMTFWAPHMIGLLKTYEKGGTWEGVTYPGKPVQHLVGIGSMHFNDRFSPQGDVVLYASTADWIGPTVTATASDTFPSNVAINNQGKIVLNDSDHALGYQAFVNLSTGAIDDVHLRDYVWENFTNNASGQVFMDPYIMSLTVNQRNPCANPVGGVCPNPMTKYDPFRAAMGGPQVLMPRLVDYVHMTTQNSLASTSFALVNNDPVNGEFVVYAPTGGAFTVNLSAQNGQTLNFEWLNPVGNAITAGGTVAGGSATQSFTPPWGSTNDAVLHIYPGGPQPFQVGWTEMANTTPNTQCPSTTTFPGIGGSTGCDPAVMSAWNGGFKETKRNLLLFWGGGHSDYFGNEIYYVDPLKRTVGRLTNPASNPNASCSGTLTQIFVWQNGTPNSPHGYTGMGYMPHVDKSLFAMGDLTRGNNTCPLSALSDAGGRRWDSWLFNNGGINYSLLPNAPGNWTPLPTLIGGAGISFVAHPLCTNGACGTTAWGKEASPIGEWPTVDWDPVLQQELLHDQFSIYAFNALTSVATQLSASGVLNTSSVSNTTGAIDPPDRIFWLTGNGQGIKFDLTTFAASTPATTGCSTPFGLPAPGIDFDPTMGLFVLVGDSANPGRVWLFNPTSSARVTANYGTVNALTCVAVDPAQVSGVAPAAPYAVGNLGRFRILPNVNGQDVGVYCPKMSTNCEALVLNAASKAGHRTFAQRVAGTNAVYSSALDSAAVINAGAIPSSGDGITVPVYDPTVAPTGDGTNGSAKFVTAAVLTGADMSGSLRTSSWSKTFGPPNHPSLTGDMYWQFQIKEDSTETGFNWAGPSFNNAGQKVAINHFSGSTCNSIEITWQDNFGRGMNQMYSACGGIPYDVTAGGDTLVQQGSPIDTTATVTNLPYNCHNAAKTVNDCSFTHSPHGYSAGWQTYYCHAKFSGEWNTANNTHIDCWMSYEKGTVQPDGGVSDGSFKRVINFTTSLDCNNSPACRVSTDTQGYNAIDFTMYETSGAPSGAPNNATRWYANVIVSSSPIPAPDGYTPQ
jgi:hypothetical protein